MIKKLGTYLKGYGRESVLGPLFKLLEALFELFVPLVVARMIDQGIRGGEGGGYVWKMGGLLLLLGVVGLVFSITAQYFAARASAGFASRLRETLYDRVTRLSASQLDRIGSSRLTQRLTGDVDQVQNGLNLALRLMLRSPFVVFGSMIMAFTVDGKSAWIFAVMIPALSIVVFGVMAWSLKLFKRSQANMDRVMNLVRENLTGVRVIRAFGRDGSENARFTDASDKLNASQRTAGRVSALTNPLTSVIVNLALIVLIHTGALRVDTGTLSQGQLVALVNYMSQILVELIKLANLIVSISKALACFDRVQTVIDLPEDATERAAGAALDRAADVTVRFDHVELVYPGAGAPSLEDVSFVAHRGETIGIVGPTGSGKSSLVNLIPRFYDATRGTVELYGQDVKRLSPEDIRRSVGMVPQKTVLFSGSIADNVRWGKTDASDADVLNAIDGAQGTDILSKKNEGMNAPVGQGGRALSGGQRQRVAIARALVRNADILILDDSASALDFATDARLRAAIRARQGSQTVFIVSQRASGVRYADRILVMDEGRVSAQGTHEELMQSSELYREIYFSQFPEGDHVCESR